MCNKKDIFGILVIALAYNMKKSFFLLLILIAQTMFAQENTTESILIVGKPVDPKKEFTFSISKKGNEINLKYKKVDSIGKLSYSIDDLATIKRLLKKKDKFFDSLSNDSLIYLQNKLEIARQKSTYYHTDSTSIYKTTHPVYWKLMETILKSPNHVLEKRQGGFPKDDGTYCFFTLTQRGQDRFVFIDQVDDRFYPLLSKLVNRSLEVITAHQTVMKKKNH